MNYGYGYPSYAAPPPMFAPPAMPFYQPSPAVQYVQQPPPVVMPAYNPYQQPQYVQQQPIYQQPMAPAFPYQQTYATAPPQPAYQQMPTHMQPQMQYQQPSVQPSAPSMPTPAVSQAAEKPAPSTTNPIAENTEKKVQENSPEPVVPKRKKKEAKAAKKKQEEDFYTPEGTIKPCEAFDVESDSRIVRDALKGSASDIVARILSLRSCQQRQLIKQNYKAAFGRDLGKDVSNALSSQLKEAVLSLIQTHAEFDAETLHNCLSGWTTDSEALVEILASRTTKQITDIKTAYRIMYRSEVELDISDKTSGSFKRLLVALASANRREDTELDEAKAKVDAMELVEVGLHNSWFAGVDDSKLNRILCSQSHEQLRLVLSEYEKLAYRRLTETINRQLTGDLLIGMKALVSIIESPATYFVSRLQQAFKGFTTNHSLLIRILVTRCEVDLVQIRDWYPDTARKTLEASVQSVASGSYLKLLLALIRGKAE